MICFMVIAYDMIWALLVGVNYWLFMEIFCYWPLRSEDSDVTSAVTSPMVNIVISQPKYVINYAYYIINLIYKVIEILVSEQRIDFRCWSWKFLKFDWVVWASLVSTSLRRSLNCLMFDSLLNVSIIKYSELWMHYCFVIGLLIL